MSDSDTSIEARSIINSLAATSSFSAVGFFAAGLIGTLVFNCGCHSLQGRESGRT